MRNATRILLTAAGLLAAWNSARAQGVQGAIQAPAGQAYTIISTADATAVNPVTYQWYRNNSPIVGATGASYTVPGIYAYGDNVQFYRMAKAQECAGEAEKKSNIITITFIGYVVPVGCNLVIGGICWANANLAALHVIGTQADTYDGVVFQWNKEIAYSATDPLTPSWEAGANTSLTWGINPCPVNWRLPSPDEYQQLNGVGTTWVNAGVRGASVPGHFYGYSHATCTLPSYMSGCIFLPASGYRGAAAGAITGRSTNGYYWSNSAPPTNYSVAYILTFNSGTSTPSGTGSKDTAFPIRCVQ